VTTEIRIKADEARRLKADTAFMSFVQEVRDDQIKVFTDSGASDVEAREAAHGIILALNQIEMKLDAAITAETFLDRRQRK
jgi:hypothetical protein|tara:strand:- start:209 stop:451 length:243 start_codon:yes stop_codon:yes gene_type:complete